MTVCIVSIQIKRYSKILRIPIYSLIAFPFEMQALRIDKAVSTTD